MKKTLAILLYKELMLMPEDTTSGTMLQALKPTTTPWMHPSE